MSADCIIRCVRLPPSPSVSLRRSASGAQTLSARSNKERTEPGRAVELFHRSLFLCVSLWGRSCCPTSLVCCSSCQPIGRKNSLRRRYFGKVCVASLCNCMESSAPSHLLLIFCVPVTRKHTQTHISHWLVHKVSTCTQTGLWERDIDRAAISSTLLVSPASPDCFFFISSNAVSLTRSTNRRRHCENGGIDVHRAHLLTSNSQP